MFTGIIEQIGRVAGLTPAAGGARLSIAPETHFEQLAAGESIAISGACLTAESNSRPERLEFFLSGETIERTTLGSLKAGALVNLERSLRAGDRIGGHLVTGHVDGIGVIRRWETRGEGWEMEVEFPAALAPCIAAKGSIAVDGISLTVVEVLARSFTVAIIPHTVRATTLREAEAGRRVNLEADLLARYVLRALQAMKGAGEAVTGDLLKRAGFM